MIAAGSFINMHATTMHATQQTPGAASHPLSQTKPKLTTPKPETLNPPQHLHTEASTQAYDEVPSAASFLLPLQSAQGPRKSSEANSDQSTNLSTPRDPWLLKDSQHKGLVQCCSHNESPIFGVDLTSISVSHVDAKTFCYAKFSILYNLPLLSCRIWGSQKGLLQGLCRVCP